MIFRIILGIHLTAIAAWLGGILFFLLVLRPALKTMSNPEMSRGVGRIFQEVSEIALWIVIGSGILLSLDRLLLANIQASYLVVLSIKIALVVWIALIAMNLWGRVSRTRPSVGGKSSIYTRLLRAAWSTNTQLVLGIVVVFLAEILRVIYNRSI